MLPITLAEDWKKYKINDFFEKQLKIPILFSFVTGSRLMEINSDKSDIDIVLVTNKKTENIRLPYCFEYNNYFIHGWLTSIWNIFVSIKQDFGFGTIADYLVNDDYILDCNPHYLKYKEFFFTHKENIAEMNFYLTIEKEKDQLYAMIIQDKIIWLKGLPTCLLWWKNHKDNTLDLELIKRLKSKNILPEDRPIILKTVEDILQDHLNEEYVYNMINFINDKNQFYNQVKNDKDFPWQVEKNVI